MKCAIHDELESVAVCAGCGKPLCKDCAVDLEAGSWCRECLLKAVRKTGPSFGRSIVAMVLSVIPGAGHMFLGLIGKGLAMMGLLFASVFLVILYSDTTGMYWLSAYLIPAIVVLFLSYAVFDAREIASGRPTDDSALKAIRERSLLNVRTFGFLLLVSGFVGLFNVFEAPLNQLFLQYMGVELSVSAIVIPLVLLVCGIYLLVRGRRRR